MSVQQSLGFTHVLASVVVPKHTIYEVSTTISYKNDKNDIFKHSQKWL